MEALLLKSHALPHATIASILDIDEGTLRAYLRAYRQGGIEQLKSIHWQGPQSELSQHQDTLKIFVARTCRAVVNPVEKYEDTLSPSQREAEIIQILTGVAARLLREHLAGRPADEKSQLNLLESAKQSQV